MTVDLVIPTLPNLRDLGGWSTADGGTVRRGVLYRSVGLADLDDDGLAAFGALGVRTVFDLRTEPERASKPDRVPAGTELVALDVLADMGTDVTAGMDDFLADPAAMNEHLGGGRGLEVFAGAYRNIVSLPSAKKAYAALFRQLAEPGTGPALMHCTTGKDRTGWGAAVLLLFLGVDEADVRRDYLRTNDDLLPSLAPMLDRFVAAGVDAEVFRLVFGVRDEYLDTALAEMRGAYGDLDGYLRDGFGLDEAVLAGLREAFVER